MNKLFVAIGASLLAGFAIAALTLNNADPDRSVTGPLTDIGFDDSADIHERIRALEIAVNAERQARQLLEEEIMILYEEFDAMGGAQANAAARIENQDIDLEAERARIVAMADTNPRSRDDKRRDRLVEAGFSVARADWILQREGELRMEAMQERYEAMRSGEPFNPMMRGNADLKLREDLGDAQYESYLAANGQPTAIGVSAVFDSSPAQVAGLQPGDEITHYDGKRVFNTFDLTRQTMEGAAGENVVVQCRPRQCAHAACPATRPAGH